MSERLLLLITLVCSLTSPVLAQTCAPNASPAGLSGRRPVEINPNVPPGTCGFLQFAWQDFLGLNWPPLPLAVSGTAQTRGLPDPNRVIGANTNDNPTVWEQNQPNWYL